MRLLAFTFLMLLFFGSQTHAAPTSAWWVDAHINPDCNQKGIKTVTFQNACYVLLTSDSIKSVPGASYLDLSEMRAAFQTEFVTKEGKKLFYSTAVYHGEKSDMGRAVVVAEDIQFSRIVRVERRPGITGFSALKQTGNALIWMFCLFCEDYTTIERGDPFVRGKDEG